MAEVEGSEWRYFGQFRMKVYKSELRPLLLYGAETWFRKKEVGKKFWREQRGVW